MKKVLLISALILTLCAPASAITIHGFEKNVDARIERIRGVEYVPLISVADAFGLEWQWDGIGRVVILEKNGIEMVLKVGSSKIFVKNNFERLSDPVMVSENGVVLVPIGFSGKLSRIFKESINKSDDIQLAQPVIVKEEKKTEYVEKESSGDGFKIRKIVIDAGHGGKDPGAISRGGLKERSVTLDIARRLANKLRGAGIEVIMTRDKDEFVPLSERAEIANKVKADFFVSVHANASAARHLNGFEVYYLSEALDDNARALETSENEALQFEEASVDSHTRDLDATLWDLVLTENRTESIELAKSICSVAPKLLSTPNRGVKCARFFVLKGAKMPAVLIEVGFLSNPKEAARFKDEEYRDKIAQAIAQGILNYKKEYDRTNGFTN